MEESALHWAMFVGGIGVQAIVAAFVYGRLTQSVAALAESVKRIDNDQDTQWRDINHNGRNIEKIKGKLGINGQ